MQDYIIHMDIVTVWLTFLAHSVRTRPNFQGLPWFEFDGLGEDELLKRLCRIKYFTNHGLHLNKAGKEWLVKLIASQIDKLVSDINKIEPIIALNWKEETTNVSINITNNHKPNLMITEDDFPNVLVSPIQIHNNQHNKTDSELLRKTSSRQKKTPVTRSKDFLWQLEL